MGSIRTLCALCALFFVAMPSARAGEPSGADLGVSKSGPKTASADTDIAYTLTIINGGPDAAASAQLNDNLPAGLTFVSITQDNGTPFVCTDPGVGNPGSVSCVAAALPAGDSAQFTLVAHIDPKLGPGNVITNIATVTSPTFDSNEENNAAPTTTTLPAPQSDVLVQKLAPESVGPDQDLTYSITVANLGPDAAPNFNWQDPLPGDLTFVSAMQLSGPTMSCSVPAVGGGGTVSCSVASFGAGDTAQFELVVHVPAGTPSGMEYSNTATVASDNADPNEINNSSITNTTVSAIDLAVAKTGPASVVAGATVSYNLTISNAGPDFATSVNLVDALPAPLTFVSMVQNTGPQFICATPGVGANGTVTCSTNQLAPGASAQFTLTAQVPAGTPNGSSVVNTANATTSQFDNDTSNNSASATTGITNTADVGVSKTSPPTASAGGMLVYTLVVSNDGPDVASGVALSDTLPAGTTFVSLTQTGATFGCTTPAPGAGGGIACNAATLASGASTTLTLTVQVFDAAADGTTLSNTATVASTSADPNATNDSATAETGVVNQANLALTKTGPAGVNAGDSVVYTLVLTNNGPSPAANVALDDTLPANTTFVSLTQSGTPLACTTPAVGATGAVACTAASYANAASTTLTLTLQVSDAVPNPFAITNTADVSTTTTDPNPADNTATTTTNATNTADLAVTKTAPATAAAGGTLAYTLTASNAGPLDDSATLFDSLPTDTTFVSLTQNSGPTFACTTPAVGATGSVTCTNADFASGASAAFTLTVLVGSSYADGATLTNAATIDGTRTDPNPANDTAAAATTISNLPNLVLDKTAPERVDPGTSFAYVLELANTGDAPALGVVLSDPLPSPTRFQAIVQNGGPAFACTTPAVGSSGTVSCSIASLAAGATASFTLTVSTPAGAGGAVTNTATVTSTSADAAPADNASAAATLLGFAPSGAPITIPVLSWFGLLALVAAIGLLGAAMSLRTR